MNIGASLRGYLIAIEGCDRTGKSTQCHLACSWLQEQTGRPVEYWKFPERCTAIGRLINGYLGKEVEMGDEAVHLLFSANRWELKEKMEETLASGTSIILDRYVYSGAVYSAAKGLDLAWCKAPDHGLPQPDLVLFLDLSAEIAQARSGYGEERYEKIELQQKVRKLFNELSKGDAANWRIVDADRTVDELAMAIQGEISENLFNKEPLGPLSSLNWI